MLVRVWLEEKGWSVVTTGASKSRSRANKWLPARPAENPKLVLYPQVIDRNGEFREHVWLDGRSLAKFRARAHVPIEQRSHSHSIKRDSPHLDTGRCNY